MLHPIPRRAFTLIEMMLAIAIALAVVVLAVPNLRGVAAQNRMRESFEKFDAFTRKAQLNAVRDQRSWSISWLADRIVLQRRSGRLASSCTGSIFGPQVLCGQLNQTSRIVRAMVQCCRLPRHPKRSIRHSGPGLPHPVPPSKLADESRSGCAAQLWLQGVGAAKPLLHRTRDAIVDAG